MGWLYFGLEHFNGDGHFDEIVIRIFCHTPTTITLEDIVALQDISLQNAVRHKFFSLVDEGKIQSTCPYTQLRMSPTRSITKDMNVHLVHLALEGLTLGTSDITDINLLQAYLQTRYESFVLSEQLLFRLYQLPDEELLFWNNWISKTFSQQIPSWRLLWLRQNRPTSFISELDIVEKRCLAQWGDIQKWQIFLSGVRLSPTDIPQIHHKNPLSYTNTEQVALAAWLCSFSNTPAFQIKVLRDGLLYVQEHEPLVYKNLKQEYGKSSSGWFSSVTSKMRQLGTTIGRSFTSEIPSNLPLQETLSNAIQEIPEEHRIHLFSSST